MTVSHVIHGRKSLRKCFLPFTVMICFPVWQFRCVKDVGTETKTSLNAVECSLFRVKYDSM